MKRLLPMLSVTVAAGTSLSQTIATPPQIDLLPAEQQADTLDTFESVFLANTIPADTILRLTEEDYEEVAAELGVEVAAIKAVVDIEAGLAHQGFHAPGKPLINFDLSIYRKRAPKHGVNLTKARKEAPVIFNAPNTRKYGSKQAAQQARLDAAIAIDEASALESVFWGMFQIGGFNWKICGCESVQEFVEIMSRSERAQLELFATFCINTGYVDYIRKKNWAGFASRYNGPSYKSRGYHTKMANAYNKYKKREKK